MPNTLNKKNELETRCRICRATEYARVCAKGAHTYVRCAGCGVTRQWPYPNSASADAFYRDYLGTKQAENPAYLSETYWTAFEREKDLTFRDLGFDPATLRGRRVLDVGCAVGQFLQYATHRCATATGIDISEELVGIASGKGFDASVARLEDTAGEYDLVTMWHVIEHVPDPVATLADAYARLACGGGLIVETPCTGLISDLFGKHWRFYMPVEHLHLFSQESLFGLLRRSGFAVASWVRFGSGNDTGTIPDVNKRVADGVAKRLGIGDTIAVWAMKREDAR